MTDRLYRVLRYRILLVGICALAGVAVAVAPARAATRRPVVASSVTGYTRHAVKVVQPAPLTLAQLATMLQNVVGVPVAISCDTPGVPSPLDGHTLDAGDDGEVFWTTDAAGVAVVAPIIHVSTGECWGAEQANRIRAEFLPVYLTFNDQRYDTVSGADFHVMLHEAFHIALQSGDEGRVECAATQNAWPLVRQLHLPGWAASMMLAGMAKRHADNPPGSVYRSAC